jgi:F-type H+-transporting ATPase subunit a
MEPDGQMLAQSVRGNDRSCRGNQTNLKDSMGSSKTCLAVLTLAIVGSFLTVRAGFAANAGPPTPESAAQVTVPAVGETTAPHQEEHGLTQQALEIARPFGLPITNSMIMSWLVALGLIIFAQVSTRHMEMVPKGAQNFWEWLVESLATFLEGVIGRHLVQRTFWFFASVFIFILFANWVGLIPGVGTIGWGHQTPDGFQVEKPLFRGVNADLNMTLAMALVFFACWIIWAIREVGVTGFFKELFAPKGESSGFLKVLMVVVFFAAGCLEVISILFRPVSLSFRLYGNIFAGENMLETMGKLVPGLGWLLPIPFYFLELLVGLVQALVFMLLTAVFTLLICQHEEPEASTTRE